MRRLKCLVLTAGEDHTPSGAPVVSATLPRCQSWRRGRVRYYWFLLSPTHGLVAETHAIEETLTQPCGRESGRHIIELGQLCSCCRSSTWRSLQSLGHGGSTALRSRLFACVTVAPGALWNQVSRSISVAGDDGPTLPLSVTKFPSRPLHVSCKPHRRS